MGPQIQNFILICCFFTWRWPSKCLRIISIVFFEKSFATRERSKICRFLDLHSQKYCQSTAMCPFLKISTTTKSFHPTCARRDWIFLFKPSYQLWIKSYEYPVFSLLYVNLWGQGFFQLIEVFASLTKCLFVFRRRGLWS